MPLIKPSGDDGAQRTTFRPPWVKDGPPALPMPSAPWLPKRRESQNQQQPIKVQNAVQRKDSVQENPVPNAAQRKDSTQEKPVLNAAQRKDSTQEKPVLNAAQRKDSTQEKPVLNAAQRKDSTQEKPVLNAAQRKDSTQEKPIPFAIQQRKESRQEKPVSIAVQQRKDSTQEKPIPNLANQRKESAQEKPVPTAVQQRKESTHDKPVQNAEQQRKDFTQEKTVPVQWQGQKNDKNVTPVPIMKQEAKTANATPLQRPDTNSGKNIQVVPTDRKESQERNKRNIPIQRMDAVDGKPAKTTPFQRSDTHEAKNVALKKEEPKPLPIAKEVSAKPEKKEEVKKKVQISEDPKIVNFKDMEIPVAPPAPPMAPPMPPPPPPMAHSKPPIDLKPLTSTQKFKLEALKSRPRKRPDWTDMMKEVEEGVKLKHVQCNDRSAPVLPMAKAKGQFVYDSEKQNAHNLLLKEIQSGVRLKKVKCNDRSRPVLDGLRKFRRQMTIEEQIVKKSTSMADVVAMAAQPDELDDIDKVRDDLQSTKQMLAHELRNKETLERENKRLMARLLNLEAELEKEKSSRSIERERGEIAQTVTVQDDKLMEKLKEEADESSKMMKQMEDMYKKTAEELDVTRAKLESAWLQNAQLEQNLKNIHNNPDAPVVLPRLPSSKKLANASFATRPSAVLMSSSEEESEEEESEEESDSGEEDGANTAAQQEKRISRELRLMTAKLRGFREKRYNAKKEKSALKHQFSNLTKCLSAEKKKYRQLQKEVDKMAKLVKDVDEDEEEEPEEDEEEFEESESENDSEESEESEESEGDLPESSSSQDKISNLTRRVKVNENRLATLKKCNYLLKANIDRRQDEINKQKEVILSLQEDLNNVLAELG